MQQRLPYVLLVLIRELNYTISRLPFVPMEKKKANDIVTRITFFNISLKNVNAKFSGKLEIED